MVEEDFTPNVFIWDQIIREFCVEQWSVVTMGSKYRFFSFIFTWSLFHLGMSSPEDILNQIRVTHEKIGTCRLRCLSELSTSEQDSVCFRIPKCRTCWDLCQRFALNKKDEQVFCARHDPEICDDTCQLSCKSLQVETMKESLIRTPSVVLSTSFVGCTLFWKTNYDNTNIAFINQLYGVDDQVTNCNYNSMTIIPYWKATMIIYFPN